MDILQQLSKSGDNAPRCPECKAGLCQSNYWIPLAVVDPNYRWVVRCPGCHKPVLASVTYMAAAIMSKHVQCDVRISHDEIDWESLQDINQAQPQIT